MMNIRNVIGDYESFYNTLTGRIISLGIDITHLYVDHFCYRTTSIQNYVQKKSDMLLFSDQFIENLHHGRPISKFKLTTPLIFYNQNVDVIELPAPKKGNFYKEGLEHFEFVVGKDFHYFVDKYKHLWSGQDESGRFNKPVYIKFKEGVVKFHEKALVEVIKLEGNKWNKLAT